MKMISASIAALAMGTAANALPVNDLIDDAITLAPLTLGVQSIAGTTIDATTDFGAPFSGTSITSPGVWYTLVGNGGTVNLNTCNTASYDTKISVFSGYTGSNFATMTAIGGNDDGAGCAGFTSNLDFASTAATTYWVLVHGFAGASGDFTLNYSSDRATAPVPLPASGVLFLAALGALGLYRRRS